MKTEGECHCGHVKFVAVLDPELAGICHCTDCQRLSGSAFRMTVRSVSGTFAITSGTVTTYVKTTADSGTKREHAFCPRCGTPIYATSVGPEPKVHSLRPGTFRVRDVPEPKRQIWTRSRLPWLDRLASLPSSEKQ